MDSLFINVHQFVPTHEGRERYIYTIYFMPLAQMLCSSPLEGLTSLIYQRHNFDS